MIFATVIASATCLTILAAFAWSAISLLIDAWKGLD